jgi:hypothetical protein
MTLYNLVYRHRRLKRNILPPSTGQNLCPDDGGSTYLRNVYTNHHNTRYSNAEEHNIIDIKTSNLIKESNGI